MLFGGALEGAGPLESATSDVCDDEEDPEDSPSDAASLSESESILEVSSELSEELLDSALSSMLSGFVVGRRGALGSLSSSELEPDEEVESELGSGRAGI